MTEKLKALVNPSQVLINENLKNHTTFKVGGPCEALVRVNNKEELIKALRLIKDENKNYFILGNGSNILVSDNGYEGIAIKLSGDFLNISVNEKTITAGAAAILSRVAVAAKENSLTGLEFAHGIPGSVGGAMVMNAGAYDGEMKQVVKSVTLLNKNLETVVYSNAEMDFGYRHSALKEQPLIALSVEFSLAEGDKNEIAEKMNTLMEKRRAKQPIDLPSAGSTFKRPEGNFAGKLIEDAGLRGFRIGGASVSEKHCGFVVNDKNATAKEINELIEEVIKRVKEASGIVLEPEVIRLGDFN